MRDPREVVFVVIAVVSVAYVGALWGAVEHALTGPAPAPVVASLQGS